MRNGHRLPEEKAYGRAKHPHVILMGTGKLIGEPKDPGFMAEGEGFEFHVRFG